MEYQDNIDAATRQLTVQVCKDVDDALDQALNRHGVFDAYTLEKGRLTVSLQDGISVYMLDNKPIVTVSKPQLEVVGTSYRVYFKIEQHRMEGITCRNLQPNGTVCGSLVSTIGVMKSSVIYTQRMTVIRKNSET